MPEIPLKLPGLPVRGRRAACQSPRTQARLAVAVKNPQPSGEYRTKPVLDH
jgi:hypothetical protein